LQLRNYAAEQRDPVARINAVHPEDFFGFYAGQPAAMREEFKVAMGL
jgi:hypothetical protein